MIGLAVVLVIAAAVALAYGLYCDVRATRRNGRLADDAIEPGHDSA